MSKTFFEILKKDIEIEKFNPYHDRLGRFTTGGTATSMTEEIMSDIAEEMRFFPLGNLRG